MNCVNILTSATFKSTVHMECMYILDEWLKPYFSRCVPYIRDHLRSEGLLFSCDFSHNTSTANKHSFVPLTDLTPCW